MTGKAFRQAVRVGVRLWVTDHWLDRHRHTLRTVTEVQSDAYFFTQEGDTQLYRGEYLSALYIQFDGTTASGRDGDKYWTFDLTPNGTVDHVRWERSRKHENEIEGERRMAEEAAARGADMQRWWRQWFERSDEWRDEIGHEREETEEISFASPGLDS